MSCKIYLHPTKSMSNYMLWQERSNNDMASLERMLGKITKSMVNARASIKCLHSLIKLSLPSWAVEMETCIQEEVWTYYQEALNIITSCDEYPEVESLWLMTQAWNTGIFQYSVKKYTDAERWCALAMRLLNYIGTLKSSYENQ
ncbi:testis-expressed sequence 11 -like, partial, partial [Pelobates cultripes]